MQKIGLRGRALAEGRNVLSTNHLTQAVGPIRWAMWAESSYGQGDSGCVEERFLCTKSDIFSATKVLAAGFNPVRASTSPGRCRPVD